MPLPEDRGNPASRSDWEQAARQNKLDPETVALKESSYHSASKLAFDEFLHLKILVSRHLPQDFEVSQVIGEKAYNGRQKNDFSDFGKVVSACGKNDPLGIVEPSTYAMVQYFTHLVMLKATADVSCSPKIMVRSSKRLRSKPDYNLENTFERLGFVDTTPYTSREEYSSASTRNPRLATVSPATPLSSPRTAYEAVVNMAVVMLLGAIRLQSSHLADGYWRPDPKAFTLATSEGEDLLEARVDGFLAHRETGSVLAIVETKPFLRRDHRHDPNRNHRNLGGRGRL